jgi:hypothetical protein
MMAAGITGSTLKGGLDIIGNLKAETNPQTPAKAQKALNVKPRKKANYFWSDGCFVYSIYFPEN